jgi:hypothetical protein
MASSENALHKLGIVFAKLDLMEDASLIKIISFTILAYLISSIFLLGLPTSTYAGAVQFFFDAFHPSLKNIVDFSKIFNRETIFVGLFFTNIIWSTTLYLAYIMAYCILNKKAYIRNYVFHTKLFLLFSRCSTLYLSLSLFFYIIVFDAPSYLNSNLHHSFSEFSILYHSVIKLLLIVIIIMLLNFHAIYKLTKLDDWAAYWGERKKIAFAISYVFITLVLATWITHIITIDEASPPAINQRQFKFTICMLAFHKDKILQSTNLTKICNCFSSHSKKTCLPMLRKSMLLNERSISFNDS